MIATPLTTTFTLSGPFFASKITCFTCKMDLIYYGLLISYIKQVSKGRCVCTGIGDWEIGKPGRDCRHHD